MIHPGESMFVVGSVGDIPSQRGDKIPKVC